MMDKVLRQLTSGTDKSAYTQSGDPGSGDFLPSSPAAVVAVTVDRSVVVTATVLLLLPVTEGVVALADTAWSLADLPAITCDSDSNTFLFNACLDTETFRVFAFGCCSYNEWYIICLHVKLMYNKPFSVP